VSRGWIVKETNSVKRLYDSHLQKVEWIANFGNICSKQRLRLHTLFEEGDRVVFAEPAGCDIKREVAIFGLVGIKPSIVQ
jgi:hypothetical protein